MKRHRSGEAAEALDRGDSAKRHRSGEAAEEIDRGDSAKRWIFSAPIDLAVFGGTALVSLALLFCGPRSGTAAPEWSWIVGVLFVDVAHVWSTSFVVYLDPAEWQRRPVFYAAVPIGCFLGGIALYACGAQVFWRVIAYLAVFHFIRQQYGWVMMYRARCEERDRIGRWLDGATIYLATIYPVIVWHTKLPRAFAWMKEGDFVTGLPAWTADVAGGLYAALLVVYVLRAVLHRPVNWGKHLVVAATAACWYVGIVATNGDYAFTVTNVFIHGVPYLVLVFLYAKHAAREPASANGAAAKMLRGGRGLLVFLATLWAIAYFEELVWDRALWHERSYLFGSAIDVGGLAVIIAPLLAVPQLAHYVLDGFLWRRRANPRLGRLL